MLDTCYNVIQCLLATTFGKESTISDITKPSSNNADVVLLEIDVKEPAKRSPIAASSVYGASPSQFIIRHGDDAQDLSPEYLALVEQYTNAQPQAYVPTTRTGPPPRRPQSPFSRQQQQLQQEYQRQRVPAVVPSRPRLALHPAAEAQAERQAEYQAQIEARERAEARLRASETTAQEYQVPTNYNEPKLGTFEQELLQLVSANQAQEFKHGQQKPESYIQYREQLAAYPVEQTPAAPEHQQYLIETTQPRYHQPQQLQHAPAAYQDHQAQYQLPQQPQHAPPKRPYRPPPQYVDPAVQQAHAEAEAQAVAHAQAQAQAAALAFQKISQASHHKHQQAALEQIRIVNDRYKQQSALEQINQGQVSEAGREHIEEQVRPKDPEAAYRARLKAQAAAEAAEARKAEEAAGFKAHADAILALQRQQQAHLKAQEDAHNYALNFEKNQMKAQAQAQAIANAQALALYKHHQAARAKAHNEAHLAARAQEDSRRRDPEHTPVVQYLLPNSQSTPLPPPNSYYTSDQLQKYQASGSSYVPRSAPKPEPEHHAVNQPRLAHKHKIPAHAQSSIYVTQSGLLKKAPVKSVTVEEIIEQDQNNNAQIIRIPVGKTQALTQADIDVLISAGYTVTPVPVAPRPTERPSYIPESTSAGYYLKKQKTALARPEYASYESHVARQGGVSRKQRPILVQESDESSPKVTYSVPVEPTYGTRKSYTHRRPINEK
ncbi:hypothetical protein PV327_002524 [Microctonus hyperodae]|uniref:Uncharacterized protein n=1 Tax=Microctonus hyperodae TaxID=165561 RepID=A0AA39FG59_MICHY|nr:hypothetical protein PV327_002524 [Microctonus hyperodae]